MLARLELSSMEELIERTVPSAIRMREPLAIGPGVTEHAFVRELSELASKNRVHRSFLGTGYSNTIVPPVLLRNVLENPGWYTQYTPYQAEISQGRLEALLVFQTMVADLTGLALANASLLDEGTAAAEALALTHRMLRGKRNTYLVSNRCHPQTIAVVETRARSLGIEVRVIDHADFDWAAEGSDACGILLQYPATDGEVLDYGPTIEAAHGAGALAVVAADLLSLCLLRPPGEFGADVCVGSSQRFGVPLGYGGPHAAFLATRDEMKRQIPGRIIGVSRDADGAPALRMALQTREQHIRREKATSNICTAQALLAILAGFYAVYHGPEGLRTIAERVRSLTDLLARSLRGLGLEPGPGVRFDTLTVALSGDEAGAVLAAAREDGMLLRDFGDGRIGISLDETSTVQDVADLAAAIARALGREAMAPDASSPAAPLPTPHARTSAYLEHPVFHEHRSEHEMLRYIKRLEARDLSLTTSMISLGSCTMKLNATSEMIPITWSEFADLHPFAPAEDTLGYAELLRRLESDLAEITGFDAVSLQPNAGSQGEYAGMSVIRAWHESRGEGHRNVCLIPVSAHGTNPASATLAGMRIVTVACDDEGNIDLADLEAKAAANAKDLAAIMVTYPSTHGVFEEGIATLCEIVHAHGGQVYLDGANMNAQVGLCRPGDFGADVCHLNLHKTFAIPHGGGGPGVGPIGTAAHLTPFLPGHPMLADVPETATGPVSSAPYGSAGILAISYAYIRMLGGEGLRRATEVAILNANYMRARLGEHYPLLFRGANGFCAHEFILDLRPFEKSAGIGCEDVAKRLMDYGFHAPTMSFPVPGTLMIEPTESESLQELDRFCDAMIAIREEIRAIEEGRADREDNPLRNAPHTAAHVTADSWSHPYSRRTAAFPAPWTVAHKFWPAVSRIDNGWGDRNLETTCPPEEEPTVELEVSPPRPASSSASPRRSPVA